VNCIQQTGQTVLTVTKTFSGASCRTGAPSPTLSDSSDATGHKPGSTRPTDSGFSKLALVKSKLRPTMGQQRLEALLLASVEKDIFLELDDAGLVVARFASKSDRQMMLD